MRRLQQLGPFRSARLAAMTSLVAVLALTLAVPGTASAGKKPKAVKGMCTSLSGNAVTQSPPPTINGCSPVPNATAPGTFTFPFAASGNVTIHWANGATTTFSYTSKTVSPTKVKKGKTVHNNKFHCPANDQIEAFLKGKVTGNGSLPAGDTGLKAAVKATVCVDANYNVSLLGGTSMAL